MVDRSERDKPRCQQQACNQQHADWRLPCDESEAQCGKQFNERITHRDGLPALEANTTPLKPAKDRDVVLPANRGFAIGAVRGRP